LIDLLAKPDIRSIAEEHHTHCVSMYLPTHRAGPEVQQDPIRLKNLIARARDELVALGQRREDAEAFLAPARDLLSDSDFWAHGERGLAVLVGPEDTRVFRLADAGDELLVVSDRFHVKPLVRSLAAGESYWILAISQNRVRLLRGDPNGASELSLEEIPESLAEALWFEDRERQIQSHAASRVGAGRVTATFHGQGGTKDTRHSDLVRFLRAVDAGVAQLCADSPDPVVLAGVERDIAAFHEVTQNKQIVPETLNGNCACGMPSQPDRPLPRRMWPQRTGRRRRAGSNPWWWPSVSSSGARSARRQIRRTMMPANRVTETCSTPWPSR
jgi:hypothetical protein